MGGIKLECIVEATLDGGEKIMEFTKGEIYEGEFTDEGPVLVKDDFEETEEFWDIRIMFKQIN